jgi:hypothetical protein
MSEPLGRIVTPFGAILITRELIENPGALWTWDPYVKRESPPNRVPSFCEAVVNKVYEKEVTRNAG